MKKEHAMNYHLRVETKTAVPVVADAPRKRASRAKLHSQADPLTLLSFVKDLPKRGTGRDFWAVNSTGDYAQDCLLGHAMAAEYLSHVGQGTNGDVVLLGWIVEAMIERALKEGSPEISRGLRIGFLHTVNQHAIAAARLFPRSAH